MVQFGSAELVDSVDEPSDTVEMVGQDGGLDGCQHDGSGVQCRWSRRCVAANGKGLRVLKLQRLESMTLNLTLTS